MLLESFASPPVYFLEHTAASGCRSGSSPPLHKMQHKGCTSLVLAHSHAKCVRKPARTQKRTHAKCVRKNARAQKKRGRSKCARAKLTRTKIRVHKICVCVQKCTRAKMRARKKKHTQKDARAQKCTRAKMRARKMYTQENHARKICMRKMCARTNPLAQNKCARKNVRAHPARPRPRARPGP